MLEKKTLSNDKMSNNVFVEVILLNKIIYL